MSLLVWLPLLGSLENKGIGETTITSNTLTYGAGPLGKCLALNNNYILLKNTPLVTGVNEFSFAFWHRTTSAANQCFYNGRLSVGSAIALFNIGGCMRFDDGAQHTFNGYTIPTDNTWHHYVVARDKTNVKLYVDGVLKQTMTATAFTCTATYASIGMSSQNTQSPASNALIGGLCDYRIYDHALSAKEAKELSKGLVRHYPLKWAGGTNLYKNASTVFTGGGWNVSSCMKSVVREYDEDFGSTVLKISYNNTTEAAVGNVGLFFSYTLTLAKELEIDKIYTASVYAKCDISGRTLANNIAESRVILAKDLTVTTEWKKCYATFKSTATGVITCYYITVPAGTECTLSLARPKLVEGTAEAVWSPDEDEAIYTDYAFADIPAEDKSGYSINATKVGTPVVYSSSPRYATSTYFDGDTAGYQINDSSMIDIIDNVFTMSFWIYPDSEAGVRSVYFGSNGSVSYALNIEKHTDNLLRFYWAGNPDVHIPNFTINDDEWTHVAIVKESAASVKFYKNGALIYTLSTTLAAHTIRTAQYYLGRDQRTGATCYKGAMSDFRLYGTTLSAEDIQALYDTPISIDNQGKLHCLEIIEE